MSVRPPFVSTTAGKLTTEAEAVLGSRVIGNSCRLLSGTVDAVDDLFPASTAVVHKRFCYNTYIRVNVSTIILICEH